MQLKLVPFLRRATLADAATEQFVTGLRSDLLAKAARREAISAEVLSALASFCLDCEYVLAESSEDTAKLESLDPERSEVERLMLACFRPIIAEALPIDEVASLRPVSDAVSLAVRAQYEENPYPRWRALGEVPRVDDERDILVAGCGTGREALIAAKSHHRSQIIGLDLSRTSLAYALMRSREFGIENVQLLQSDILDISLLERTFDEIKCSGVLHHMAEPLTGLLALKSVLKPGGTMKVMVYSKTARRQTLEAIALRKERGIQPTNDEIRCFRQEIFALPADHPARAVVGSSDFYSISGTRDLLFHVQEHNFTIPEVAALIGRAGLKMIRFGTGQKPEARFRQMGFSDFSDLAAWEKTEERYPGTFSNMYGFVVGL